MTPPPIPRIEPLESRIAPALTVLHPVPDIIPSIGQTGATLDLANAFDAAGSFRTHVIFTTNYIDPANPGVPQVIELELFDDKAPVTVGSFLRYVNGLAPSDFDGVFFHRSVPGFVLQGGGFAVDAPSSHIPVGPEVHNEFNPNDPERSNVVGTVAMAKTGLGPHTATSEWFVNLGDNSGNLNNQNGGFTVFAKVVQGMNVVNAIAALNRFDFSDVLNGALTDLPLQGYDPDPDQNPTTPSPLPTPAQFVTITDASVVTPTPGNAPGVTYVIESITDATTQAPTDLVSGAVLGQSLQLNYKPNASGVAKVTIRASQPGETDVLEDFLVTLKPNLVASTTANAFPSLLVPGDKADISVLVGNSGAATATGNYDIKFYLSEVTAADPQGAILDPSDVLLDTVANQALSFASGTNSTLTTEITITQKLAQVQGKTYRILAEVVPSAGTVSNELFTDDNVALNGPTHRLFNAFGTFANRTNVTMTYVDNANVTVTASLTGGGFGQFDPDGNGALGYVGVFGTSSTSALSLTTNNAATPTTLDRVFINAAIGSVSLPDVWVKGDFEANGGVKTLTLGDLGDGAATRTLTIDGFPDSAQKVAISLGKVRDVAMNSAMPVGALTAVDWRDGNASHEKLTAPSIDSVFITGNATTNGAFQADIDITGAVELPSFRLAYLDPTGQAATLVLTGAGYAHFSPQRNAATGALELFDTNATTTLAITSANPTRVDSIDINTPIDVVSLANVTVNGNFAADGGARSITLAGVGDGGATRTFTIGAFANGAQKVSLTLGRVREVTLNSAMPVSTLTAVNWLDTNASHETVTVPSIDAVTLTGDSAFNGAFQADLNVTGPTELATFTLAYRDAAGKAATLVITGGGYARFAPELGGAVGAMEIKDTNAASTVSITTVGTTQLESIDIDAAISAVSLANVTLAGNFAADGGVKTVVLGNLGNGSGTRTFTIGAWAVPTQKVAITLGQVREVAFTSAMPVGALTAVDWIDANSSSERITVPALDSMIIAGDSTHRGVFQADLTITGTTKLQTFIVTGVVTASRIQTAGDVGFMRLGGLVRSEVLVGVDHVPRTLAEFGADKRRIDTFKIVNGGAAGVPLIDSQIAAARFGSISVAKVAPNSGVARFGFVADRINNYLVGTKTGLNLSLPQLFDKRNHYAARIV